MKEQLQATPLKNDDASTVWFNHPMPIPTLEEAPSLLSQNRSDAQESDGVRTHEADRDQSQMLVEEKKGSTANQDVLKHDVLNHANFGLLPVEKKPFGSFGVSLLINGLICAAVLVLTITKVHDAEVRERKLQLTYLAQPKPYVPPPIKVKMPPIPPMPKVEVAKIVLPKPVVIPEPPKVEPIKVETKAPAIPAPVARPVVAPPAPVVGKFSTPAATEAPKVAAVAKAAGFGDPSGVTPNPNANRAATVASVGGFGAANSTDTGGAGKRGPITSTGFGSGAGAGSPNGSAHGVVASVGFGTGTQAGPTGARGSVSTTGFGSGPAAAAAVQHVQQPVTTAIVVLSKPLPQYTAEARDLHIQGDVTLEVRFTASGEVEVLRVVNGLGHGLDEQARLAAQKIRFKPATKDGKPVDQVSVIHVAFQLA